MSEKAARLLYRQLFSHRKQQAGGDMYFATKLKVLLDEIPDWQTSEPLVEFSRELSVEFNRARQDLYDALKDSLTVIKDDLEDETDDG